MVVGGNGIGEFHREAVPDGCEIRHAQIGALPNLGALAAAFGANIATRAHSELQGAAAVTTACLVELDQASTLFGVVLVVKTAFCREIRTLEAVEQRLLVSVAG